MFIGKLNNRLCTSVTVTGINVPDVIEPLENGNPLKHERLKLWWTQVHSMHGIDIHLKLSGGYWINNLVLHLGEDCEICRICAYDKTKTALLCEYSGEMGQQIRAKEIVLPVECREEEIILSMAAPEANAVSIEYIEVYGSDADGDFLYPPVNEISLQGEGTVCPMQFKTVSADCETAQKAVKLLSEKYSELTGISLQTAAEGDIRLCFDANAKEEEYKIDIGNAGITITASDLRGFVYGCEVFLKLVRWGNIPYLHIKDKPNSPLRGIHLYLPAVEDIPFFKRFIKYAVSPLGYNVVILEIGGSMEFRTHPEINRSCEMAREKAAKGIWPRFPHSKVGGGKTLPQSVIRELVEYIRSFGIEAVPEVQSLTHVEHLTITYPEIAETSDEPIPVTHRDGRSDFYDHDYCPSNPKTYEIMFDILGEVLDVFAPCKLVHMGRDELKKIGVCPRCKGKDPAKLYAEDVWKYRNFLHERGAKMMFWADAVSSSSVLHPQTTPAIDLLPKDVILLDFIWYVYPGETEDSLLPHGIHTAVGNFYSSHYERPAERLAKKGMVGGEISMWAQTREDALAAEGKLYDLFYLANILCSGEYSPHLRYSYDRMIQKEIAFAREMLQKKTYPSLHAGYAPIVLVDKGAFSPKNSIGGEFAVQEHAESLVFEHTAADFIFRIPWSEFEHIGSYIVTYADGTTAEIPLTYTGNIGYWNRRFGEPFKGRYYRHNGYIGAMWYTTGVEGRLKDGTVYTLYRYEWLNPKPQVKIEKVEYRKADGAKTDVIVNKLTAYQKSE